MARGRKTSLVVPLTDEERLELEHLQRRTAIAAGLSRRARIILLRADGHSLVEIARRVGVATRVVSKWIKRYIRKGSRGLGDKTRPGRPPVFSPLCGHSSDQNRLRETG